MSSSRISRGLSGTAKNSVSMVQARVHSSRYSEYRRKILIVRSISNDAIKTDDICMKPSLEVQETDWQVRWRIATNFRKGNASGSSVNPKSVVSVSRSVLIPAPIIFAKSGMPSFHLPILGSKREMPWIYNYSHNCGFIVMDIGLISYIIFEFS